MIIVIQMDNVHLVFWLLARAVLCKLQRQLQMSHLSYVLGGVST